MSQNYYTSLIGFLRSRDGNFAIMTALLLPVILLASLSAVSYAFVFFEQKRLDSVAKLACNRAVKPTRMNMYDDSARKSFAEKSFDDLAKQNGLVIKHRSVEVDWLKATVKASMNVDFIGGLGVQKNYALSTSETCLGVPPYPALQDVILSSDFTKPDGTPLVMIKEYWGVYKPQAFGWDGGTGPGVEIQDWGSGKFGKLPEGISSRYVVELDSHGGKPSNQGNSSMSRIVELHRGTYRFSLWYYGRTDDSSTNRISAYLEGVRPVSKKVQKLTVAEPLSKGWIYKSFDIEVNEYSIYKFTLAAEGKDDTVGGNFNDLRLTYLKRPKPNYND